MAISVFTESYDPTMGNHRRQVIMAPIDGTVRVYSRVTDGQKGPHNKWLETDIDSLGADFHTNERLTAEPVAVQVTVSDERQIRELGYSPTLGTKTVAAHGNSGVTEDDDINRVFKLYEAVSNNDDSLVSLIIDRRQEVKTFVAPAVPQASVAVEVTTEAEVEQFEAPVIHAALASIPPRELDDRYVHRDVMGGIQDYKAYDFARANHINVLIYGPTGPGKTTSIEAWCAARGLRLAQVSGNAALEPSHLFGRLVPDGHGSFAWVDGPVTDVVRNGGVLNLDEVNFISPKIYTVLYSLLTGQRMISLLDHHGEVIKAHPDLTIFATMNPDYIGTGQLNAAFRNRFDMQLPWEYDTKVESQLVKSKNLLVLANQLRAEAAKGQYETPISTNMLVEFGEFVQGLGYEFAVENFIAHFENEEQPSVRLVFQTHEYNLKPDFGIEIVAPTQTTADDITNANADRADASQAPTPPVYNANNAVTNPVIVNI
jgi:hypothetical protein